MVHFHICYPQLQLVSSNGAAVGVSVSVAFVVSFSTGVLVASVCYSSSRSKESSLILYMPLFGKRWSLIRTEMLWR